MPTPEEIAAGLTAAEVAALKTLPLPGWKPDRVFAGVYRNVSYSSTWRKSTQHRWALENLQAYGLVEWKVSRGETLWRLTRPEGTAVRQHILGGDV